MRARLALVAALSVIATLLPLAVSPAGADPKPVSGGGSSFAQLELEQWRADVAKPPFNLSVDYSAAGSTFGRSKFAAGQFDYGVTDIEYQPSDSQRPANPFVYVPVSAGGVGFMYNVVGLDGRRITSLKLSQVNICRVFAENNMYWDDAGIRADNPGLLLPHNLVNRVVRSDGAGTSFVFSDFCLNTAPTVWSAFVAWMKANDPNDASGEFLAAQPTSQWPSHYPNSTSAFASDGVANVVSNDVAGKNSITYAEAGFAKVRGFPNAFIRNAAGIYTAPTSTAVTVALGYANKRDNGTFSLNYLGADQRAYFPSTYSYALVQTAGQDPGKGLTLATFLFYAACQGQARAEPLGYARLSSVLVDLALAKISQIPGAPAAPAASQCGAPPPPVVDPNFKPVPAPQPTANRAVGAAKSGAGANSAVAGGGAAAATDQAAANGAAENAADATDAAADSGTTRLNTSGPAAQTASASGVSGKEGLWFLLLGFGLVGLGTMGGGADVLRRRKRGGGL